MEVGDEVDVDIRFTSEQVAIKEEVQELFRLGNESRKEKVRKVSTATKTRLTS